MRILFVHQNFPGQFRHLAPTMAARGHDCVALTRMENKQKLGLPFAKYRFKHRQVTGWGGGYHEFAERGAAAARAARGLRDKHGFTPDVIFGHSGWGETLFLREVWPSARLLNYAEFLYRSEGLDAGFDPEFQGDTLEGRMRIVARQTHLIQGLALADASLSPTQWQANSFPELLRRQISVIHDGVDTERVRPDPQARFALPDGRMLTPGDEVLTFVNRNLEPYRGFHIFMRALPAVLKARPEAQVVLIGGQERGYGATPIGGKSWKQVLLQEVGGRLDLSRVHFVGRVPYPQFLSLIQVSRVHAYLTYPFVLSWSMLEAMSAGAYVVGSRTGPVEEVIEDGSNGRLVDFFDVDGWAQALISGLENPHQTRPLRQAARRTILNAYDLKSKCLPRLIDFVETAGT
ncbi:glycosyltransferase involved in cell wall biosynthesis [Rhodovulum imhoffii]|uniref:Glycosyltransferase involved in cell wall biosynthesis n=1 Tax=Rhodovulum imhoffii TaxID=365340 RepID=A0A2T5BPF9_9RHOB|nr:glycosyltransferase [Rhodovulum imhoffii]MBK5932634.1 glycosyl transferase family 1 [Rhodovulum imhoffii]PTN00912.1 glycosyltransferase involved in cell wall biosynthesis [Rhodovulum imhoffii]